MSTLETRSSSHVVRDTMASTEGRNGHAAIEAEAPPPSLVPTLNNIPFEILLSIADHLPASSRALLSLTTQRMSDILNPNALHGIQNNKISPQGNDQQRIDFLYLYSVDHHKYFACQDCKVLHLTKLVVEPGAVHPEHRQYKLPCMKNGSNFNPSVLGGHYRINYAHVSLAVRHLSLDRGHGIPLSAFDHQDYRPATPAVPAHLFSVEARLIRTTNMRPQPESNIGLAVRSQQVFLMEPDTRWELLTVRSFGPLCEHVHNQRAFPPPQHGIHGIHSAAAWQTTTLTFDEIFRHGNQAMLGCTACDLAAILIACPRPPSSHPYVSLTRWTNLGTGQSMDDGVWNIHRHDQGRSTPSRGAYIQFEIARGMSNLALLKKNLECLKKAPAPSHGWRKKIWASTPEGTCRSVAGRVAEAVLLRFKRCRRGDA
ncbi:hypothetical protein BJ875DRAFT_457475 [Amylocarpus encephaloides]|uniref:F-box domain-containing protein n=1 Tax=Amylocarpus encephaloides TaxID=45428 RepID=A0A9P7YM75_9HELO|nr:hypothetical protein BJ875DRAFT_457475 [Amylocarpus encephaloides]